METANTGKTSEKFAKKRNRKMVALQEIVESREDSVSFVVAVF